MWHREFGGGLPKRRMGKHKWQPESPHQDFLQEGKFNWKFLAMGFVCLFACLLVKWEVFPLDFIPLGTDSWVRLRTTFKLEFILCYLA